MAKPGAPEKKEGQGGPDQQPQKKNPESAGGHGGHGGGSAPAHGGKAGKGHSPLPGGCHAVGCKAPEKRFTFCDEHYEQFKFGLIKKSGELVSDHEKKFEQYQAYKARRSAQKVA